MIDGQGAGKSQDVILDCAEQGFYTSDPGTF